MGWTLEAVVCSQIEKHGDDSGKYASSRTDVSKPWTHLKGEEEFCMLTERAIEEPNLRRSAEMKDMLYDPLCLVFQPSSKLELIHIWD